MVVMHRPTSIFKVLLPVLLCMTGCARTTTEKTKTVAKSATENSAADSIIWLQRGLEVDGMSISVGHRGSAEPGQSLDTIVSITKDDKPVAGAMVFYQIVSSDDGSTLSPEVTTVFEPPSGGEPACFAQGKLEIPEDIVPVAVRVRIVMPELDKEWTKDFLISQSG